MIKNMYKSSFLLQISVLYVFYGFFLGFGLSLIYAPSLTILGHYFRKR